MHIDVIGAGFAGLSAAIAIKEHAPNIDVIIHEQYDTIGYNPDGRRCGEAHTVKNEWMQWMPSKKSIFTMITKGVIICGTKKVCYHEKKNTGFILNRPEFLYEIAKRAKNLGVNIQTNDSIKDISSLDGKYIIDASGSRNTIKTRIGLKHGIHGISYQETIQDPQNYIADTIQIFWSKLNGYYWIFPRDPKSFEINVGVGYFNKHTAHLQHHLKKFKKQQGISGKITYKTSGLIPFGLQPPYLYDNVLFVGDTAVGTFPLSGQGIYRALISGDIAGTCIARGQTKSYPSLIRHAFISREEVIGQLFLYLIEFCKHINPDLVFRIVPLLFNASNSINRYSIH